MKEDLLTIQCLNAAYLRALNEHGGDLVLTINALVDWLAMFDWTHPNVWRVISAWRHDHPLLWEKATHAVRHVQAL